MIALQIAKQHCNTSTVQMVNFVQMVQIQQMCDALFST